MKQNKIFKEIECRIVEVSGRPYVSLDDLDRIHNDLCFTKSELDIPTLRTIKRLHQSIALTYKALKEGDLLDVNDVMAIIPLSKKRVKNLIKKSLAIAKKEQTVDSTQLDPLEDYLAEETPSLSLSKEEAEDLITNTLNDSLEPYLGLFKALLKKNTETKASSSKKKQETKSKSSEEQTEDAAIVDDELSDVDFDALENNK